MNDNDDLNDSAVLSAGARLNPGGPCRPHRAGGHHDQGLRARRRRLGGLSIAGAGACAALVVGLAGGWGSAGPAPQAGPVSQHGALPVHLAAFSVAAGPRRLHDADPVPGAGGQPRTRSAGPWPNAGSRPWLRPASSAARPPSPAPGVGDVVVLPGGELQPAGHGQGPGPIVIYGSRIPSGVELSIGYRQDPQDKEISFSLIQAGAPLSCTSIPDSGPHGND